MNRKTLFTVLLCASSIALANHERDEGGSYQDYAKVKSVTPEYESVNVPRQVCRNEYIREREERWDDRRSDVERGDRSYAGVVLGGVTGALVGSRFGKGNGNSAAIAAGAIAGAMIGDQVQANNQRNEVRRIAYDEPRHHQHRGRTVQRCTTEDNWEKRITGYRVMYEYAGRSYSTFTQDDPGRTILVNVSVTPN